MKNTKRVEDTVESSAPEPAGSAEDIPVAAETTAAEALAAERDRLSAEKEELNDRLLRLHAEFDNFRRRTQREQAEIFERAAMETVATLLPVVDDFERALKVETADTEYAKGIALIYQRLLDTLKKAGLECIESQGKPFDPNVHEALDMVPTAEMEDHTVFDVFRTGYNFRGKLLRPAMVRVAVRPQE